MLWDTVPLLLGSGPKIVAMPAIAFTGLGIGLRPEFRTRLAGLSDRQLAGLAEGVAVLGLVLWEFLQRGSVRLRFDGQDITATILSRLACGVAAARLLRATPAQASVAP